MKFSELVLNKLKQVRKGKITTYGLLAKACGRPGAARAVGNVLNKNKFAYSENISENKKVPCHRVIKSNGEIGGFAKGVDKKIVLLKSEGIRIEGGRIADFAKYIYSF